MTDHDPLCRAGQAMAVLCECAHIRRVRADERERIAQAIEADRDSANRGMTPPAWFAGMDNAAGVARNGGGDE